MRIEPVKKGPEVDPNFPLSTRVEQVTRKIAIAVAFISTFVFFFKILFF